MLFKALILTSTSNPLRGRRGAVLLGVTSSPETLKP